MPLDANTWHRPDPAQAFDGTGNDYNLALEQSCGWAAVEVRARRGWRGCCSNGGAAQGARWRPARSTPCCSRLVTCTLPAPAACLQGWKRASEMHLDTDSEEAAATS